MIVITLLPVVLHVAPVVKSAATGELECVAATHSILIGDVIVPAAVIVITEDCVSA